MYNVWRLRGGLSEYLTGRNAEDRADCRRYLVMEEADFPASLQEAVTSLEAREHPFRGTQATRLTWTEGLEIPSIKDQRITRFFSGSAAALP